MTEKLLPCPFCGNDVASQSFWYGCVPGDEPRGYHVFCLECSETDTLDGPRRDTLEEAIAAWNRRAPAPEGEAIDERTGHPTRYAQPLYASPVVPVGADQGSRSKASVPTEGGQAAVLDDFPPRQKWPEKGTRLRFLGKNGYDFQLQEALRVLNVGAVYTCTDCRVGDWEHSVALENVPGRFNGVMFEVVAAPASPITGGYEPKANEPNQGDPSGDTGREG